MVVETKEIIKVGIADLKFAKSPEILRTSGLGSCVGVVVYDLSMKIAGMSHVMLPSSSLSKRSDLNQLKYADTAVPLLIDTLIKEGARKYALKAKIAGGAQMFSFSSSNDMLRVGKRNEEAVKVILDQYRVPIISEDVGGNSGRTIEFSLETGMLQVRTVNLGEKQI
ncbi:chemoreceptor glutamine deamidase CheD [Paraliobacillus quinghaiensis]|uniref:Probable chemoreceptor glutamine deamidase CheD n=1 Tax=Paraliobacillus quinghaiensis TaxID=470815 RepID=A0A917TFD7_9BACI|nr:chemotaxis protein CheD [Paraliobacillus quinghaiensis]GGM21571.1 chemoreceptor glutamine deamidase CheD [Paraliobacillus quinghaiensis]